MYKNFPSLKDDNVDTVPICCTHHGLTDGQALSFKQHFSMRFILYGTKHISAAVRTGKKSTLHLNFEYPPKSVYKLQSLPSE